MLEQRRSLVELTFNADRIRGRLTSGCSFLVRTGTCSPGPSSSVACLLCDACAFVIFIFLKTSASSLQTSPICLARVSSSVRTLEPSSRALPSSSSLAGICEMSSAAAQKFSEYKYNKCSALLSARTVTVPSGNVTVRQQ